MDKRGGSTALALTLLLGVFLQVLFAFGESANTASKTVVEFSKAYYKNDPSMAQYLCKTLVEDADVDVVQRYIRKVDLDAQNQGFDSTYLRSYLYHISTDTLSKGEDSAVVRIHSKRRKFINPVFAIIGKTFLLGDTETVDEEIHLIKENGEWKVCGAPFSLI